MENNNGKSSSVAKYSDNSEDVAMNDVTRKGDVTNGVESHKTDLSKEGNSSDEEQEKEPIALDGGYGWVVMVASFFSSVIVDGVCFAFGIFYLEYLDTFQEDRAKTAWIGSVLNGMYMITAPLSGALAKKLGCRPVAIVGAIWASLAFFCSTFSQSVTTLIIVFGMLGGFGFGLMYLPSIVMVGFYFDKRRALATGIATCGSGIGAFLFAPICKTLIDVYGWRGAQWILAGFVLHGVILGALYRPLTAKDIEKKRVKWRQKHNKEYLELDVDDKRDDPKEQLTVMNGDGRDLQQSSMICGSVYSLASVGLGDNQEKEGSGSHLQDILDAVKETMDFTMLKNPVFVIYGLSCILCMAGFFVPFIYLPDHALGLGYSISYGAFLLSILGITNTVGRVLAGWLSDRAWADCLLINNISLIVGGLATIACPFCNTYPLLAAYASVFGLCLAAFVSLRSIILVDLIGLEKLTSSFGIIVLCQGISSFFGAPLAGWLYDLTGSYNLSFYVAGTTITLAGLICMPLRKLNKCQGNAHGK